MRLGTTKDSFEHKGGHITAQSAHPVLQMSAKQFDQLCRQVLEPQIAGLDDLRQRASILGRLGFFAILLNGAAIWISVLAPAMTLLLIIYVINLLLCIITWRNIREIRPEPFDRGFFVLITALWIVSLFLYLFWFPFLYPFSESGPTIACTLLISALFVVRYIIIRVTFAVTTYQPAFKQVVIPQLLKHAGPKLTYTIAPEYSPQILAKCGLIDTKFSDLTIRDEISGYMGQTPFTASNVEAKRRRKPRFRGLLCSMELVEKFDGWLRITPKRSLSGRLYTDYTSDRYASKYVVKIDDEKFDARFRVYGSSVKAVHTFLTPKLMAKLVELSPVDGNFATSISLALSNNVVYVTLPATKDFLQPPLNMSPAFLPASGDRKVLAQLLYDVNDMLWFISYLNVQNY